MQQNDSEITDEAYKEARRILRCLFLGLDPANHIHLSQECVVMQPEVKVALQLGIEGLQKAQWMLQRRSSKRAQVTQKPTLGGGNPGAWTKRTSEVERVGQGWSTAEEQKLLQGLRQGKSLQELSASHGRTTGGILARMVKIDFVTSRQAARQHFQRSSARTASYQSVSVPSSLRAMGR